MRAAWVYGRRGKNFLLTIQRLARERAVSGAPLRVVHDQVGEAAPGVTVKPITTHEYPTQERRPTYSVLDPSLLETVFGVALPRWREQLGSGVGTVAVV
jgi:dTDP-4-dehydrorhamnose reductase